MPISIRSLAVSSTPFYLIFASVAAFANPSDSLQLTVNSSITHDDNLFRLSGSANPRTAIGRDSPEETITATTLAAAFSKQYGLQQIDLKASAVRYDYHNFSYLSFTAFNYSGGLGWKLTPRLHGVLKVDRKETLAGFGDSRNLSARNQRIESNERADSVYELDGAWQFTGGLGRYSVHNEAGFVEQRSFTLISADAGVRRLFPSGTSMGLRLRKGSGDYTQVSYAAASLLPSSFDETETEAFLAWPVTKKSRIDARVSYLSRKASPYSVRDYSGMRASSVFLWGLSARTSVTAMVSRDISDYQAAYSNYMQVDRLSIAPALVIQEKLVLRMTHEFSRRNFGGSIPGVVVPVKRTDQFQLSRLAVEWQPREFLAFSTWIQRDKRNSNFSGLDYRSQSVGVLAQISF
jgi:exopolysaccharide biosynthesis operon protein EpsL